MHVSVRSALIGPLFGLVATSGIVGAFAASCVIGVAPEVAPRPSAAAWIVPQSLRLVGEDLLVEVCIDQDVPLDRAALTVRAASGTVLGARTLASSPSGGHTCVSHRGAVFCRALAFPSPSTDPARWTPEFSVALDGAKLAAGSYEVTLDIDGRWTARTAFSLVAMPARGRRAVLQVDPAATLGAHGNPDGIVVTVPIDARYDGRHFRALFLRDGAPLTVVEAGLGGPALDEAIVTTRSILVQPPRGYDDGTWTLLALLDERDVVGSWTWTVRGGVPDVRELAPSPIRELGPFWGVPRPTSAPADGVVLSQRLGTPLTPRPKRDERVVCALAIEPEAVVDLQRGRAPRGGAPGAHELNAACLARIVGPNAPSLLR